MLPQTLTHLSGFASLNKDYLKPHDTIHVVTKAGEHFHGVVDMTWASPTKSKPDADDFLITGTDGWLGIRRVSSNSKTVSRITIKFLVKKEGVPDTEGEEVTEYESRGVEVELASFFDAISAKESIELFGDPSKALRDVGFIQAALNSHGTLVDLADLK
jgi:hypothetical protein